MQDSNDNASIFIKKIRVTSYEITNLPLMCSLSFMGYETSRLDRSSAMHLWGTTLYCHRGVLLRSDTKLLLWSETSTLLSIWNSKLAQPLYPEYFTLAPGSARGTSQSNFASEVRPRASGRGSLSPSNPHDDLTV